MADDGRLFIVEALRGLAALAVCWFHLTNTYSSGWVAATGAFGWLGVEVFFVLSGFVIPYSISKTYPNYTVKDFPRFMLRRLLRLEPPYIVSIILVLVLWHASAITPGFQGSQPNYQMSQVAAHLLYLVPLTDYSWLQPVYWTLAYEFVFYLVIGALYPMIASKGSSTAWWTFVAAGLVLASYGVLPNICLLFIFGIAGHRALASNTLTARGRGDAFVVLALITLALIWLGAAVYAFLGLLTALLLILCRKLRSDSIIGGSALSGLGTISYSLYLTHVPIGGRIVNLGRRYIVDPWGEFALSLFALAVCLLTAWLFHLVVERTAINFARWMTTLPRSSQLSHQA